MASFKEMLQKVVDGVKNLGKGKKSNLPTAKSQLLPQESPTQKIDQRIQSLEIQLKKLREQAKASLAKKNEATNEDRRNVYDIRAKQQAKLIISTKNQIEKLQRLKQNPALQIIPEDENLEQDYKALSEKMEDEESDEEEKLHYKKKKITTSNSSTQLIQTSLHKEGKMEATAENSDKQNLFDEPDDQSLENFDTPQISPVSINSSSSNSNSTSSIRHPLETNSKIEEVPSIIIKNHFDFKTDNYISRQTRLDKDVEQINKELTLPCTNTTVKVQVEQTATKTPICKFSMSGKELQSNSQLKIMEMVAAALKSQHFNDCFVIKGNQEKVNESLKALYILCPNYKGQVIGIVDNKAMDYSAELAEVASQIKKLQKDPILNKYKKEIINEDEIQKLLSASSQKLS